MELLFDRKVSTALSTIGDALEDGVKYGVFLELPWNDGQNRTDTDCILPGRYQVIPVHSLKHGANWPCLKDTPGRTAIEIHIGNKPSDVLGCTVVGEYATTDFIHNSTDTFLPLLARIRAAWARGEEVWATYQNSFSDSTAPSE